MACICFYGRAWIGLDSMGAEAECRVLAEWLCWLLAAALGPRARLAPCTLRRRAAAAPITDHSLAKNTPYYKKKKLRARKKEIIACFASQRVRSLPQQHSTGRSTFVTLVSHALRGPLASSREYMLPLLHSCNDHHANRCESSRCPTPIY